MNAVIMVIMPLISAILIYLVGALRIEGTIRAKFRLPLSLEVKILYILGTFAPMLLLPFVSSGVVGGYPRVMGIEVGIDRISLLFLLGEFVAFGSASLYVLPRITDWKELSLLLLVHSGLIGAFISKDFFNYYVFMELSAISSFALIASSKEEGSKEAAFKYLMLSMTSSYLLILALGMIYFQTGYLNVNLARDLKDDLPVKIASVALMLKAGVFPLHIWLPDAHSKAKTHVSAILSGIAVKAPVYGLILLSNLSTLDFLKPFALASMIFGVVLALMQKNVKRLLAYHTVSQMGYVLLGATISPMAAALYSLAHATFKSGLFLSLGSLVDVRRRKELEFLGARDMPILLAIVLSLSLAIAGFGLTIGGVAKSALTDAKLFVYLASVGTAMSFTKVNYYLWRGHGVEPSMRTVIPGAIPAIVVFLAGIILGGKISISDSVIILGIIMFFALRTKIPRRDFLINIGISEGVILISLLTALLSFSLLSSLSLFGGS
ncbi:proton-conducting transporter transmembrane domain-containing protein [Pyrococcus kukulkanii]|uniref:proton-conducting transporter transmembrane domain-containing protein n=1 Tax=Pyrococcus kukulkanii TaxID=1609559 RepID=UPI003562BE7A